MFKDLLLGYRSYLNALKFIKEHKLYLYFLLPILLFVGIYYLGFAFESWKNEAAQSSESAGFWSKIWSAIVYGFYTAMAYLVFKFMRYILIICLSPILSIVSERVERIITGNVYKFNLKQLIKDVKRTINLSIRNLIWEFGIVYSIWLVIMILGWIFQLPSVITGYIQTAVAMLIGFYYYGFSFIDYMNERRRLTISESVSFVKKHRGFAFALGSVFTILFHYTNKYFVGAKDDFSTNAFLVIVIVSSIIMSIIPIVTIVAATLGVHEIVDLSQNTTAKELENHDDVKKTDEL
jgi:CysZ protein